ncbi:MAG: M50 family metallopeptidase [Armatimonadota bacterium]
MHNILAAIAAFGAMIFFHELGHFLMARRAGVRVHVFALGFGPRVFAWQRGETTYALNLLPLGGFVRMEGEDDASRGADSFRTKSVGARAAIVAAGPIMNLLLAVVILAIAAATGGIPIGASTRVGTVEAEWPAQAAGLKTGDVIVAIDDVRMASGDQIIETIHKSADRPLTLTVRRGTEELTIQVTPRLDEARGVGRIGFSPEPTWTRLHPAQALVWGVQRTGQFIVMLGEAVGRLIDEGKFLDSLGGPVAAGSILVQAAQTGSQAFLHMTAFLSVIIGVFNLLPIPALDGGRLAFLGIEAIRRRPLDPRREGLVHMVGFALLLLLLVGLTLRDVRRL